MSLPVLSIETELADRLNETKLVKSVLPLDSIDTIEGMFTIKVGQHHVNGSTHGK